MQPRFHIRPSTPKAPAAHPRLPLLRHSFLCVVNGAFMIRFAAAIDLAIMSSVGPEEQTQ